MNPDQKANKSEPSSVKWRVALQSIRAEVFWPPFLLMLAACIWSLVDPDGFLAQASAVNSWILRNFSSWYAIGSLFFLLTVVVLFLSPVGKIRIGGAEARPMMSRANWFAITLCTTIAIGILFWGTAEPLYHYMGPPAFTDVDAGSQEARVFSLSTLYLHWSFTPYGIYALAAVVFALMFYNRGQRFSLAALLHPLLGKRSQGSWLFSA